MYHSCLLLKEPTGLAGGSSYAPVRLCYQQRPNRRIANLASAFPLLAARKRATRVGAGLGFLLVERADLPVRIRSGQYCAPD